MQGPGQKIDWKTGSMARALGTYLPIRARPRQVDEQRLEQREVPQREKRQGGGVAASRERWGQGRVDCPSDPEDPYCGI